MDTYIKNKIREIIHTFYELLIHETLKKCFKANFQDSYLSDLEILLLNKKHFLLAAILKITLHAKPYSKAIRFIIVESRILTANVMCQVVMIGRRFDNLAVACSVSVVLGPPGSDR